MASSETPNILALLDNLFFVAKLNEAAKSLNWQLRSARTVVAARAQLEAQTPSLIVLDLDATACQPFEFIRWLKADPAWQALPLLGFVAHVNTGVQAQARQAGCERVVARSTFARDLPRLLQSAAQLTP